MLDLNVECKHPGVSQSIEHHVRSTGMATEEDSGDTWPPLHFHIKSRIVKSYRNHAYSLQTNQVAIKIFTLKETRWCQNDENTKSVVYTFNFWAVSNKNIQNSNLRVKVKTDSIVNSLWWRIWKNGLILIFTQLFSTNISKMSVVLAEMLAILLWHPGAASAHETELQLTSALWNHVTW